MLSGLKRSETLIGVGLAVGLILVLYGANRVAAIRNKAREPVLAMAVQSQYVVAARAIPKGRPVDPADLVLASGQAPAGAVLSLDAAVGRMTVADIAARQPVTARALARTGPGGDLASLVPVGYRAISIQTTDEIAVSNLLRPGDLVDVQVVIGDPVLAKGSMGQGGDRSEAGALIQAVRVVSVGDVVGARPAAGGPPVVARTMALAMTPAQVSKFTLARSLGTFYLTLRNPADLDETPPVMARLHDLRPGAPPAPQAPVVAVVRPARRPADAPPAEGGVELVVGGERQTIYRQ